MTDLTAILASEPKTDVLREYRWTAPMFYRALDAGAFGLWPKVELIRGRLIEHPGQTPINTSTRRRVAKQLRNVFEPTYEVWERSPIAIADDTHADTDVLVVTANWPAEEERHPGPADTALLVEVSDLTTGYDLGEKALLYAQAGIGDYWVVLVLVNDLAIVQHREPTPEGYQEVTRLAGADTISPLAAPEAVWTVSALLESKE